MEEGNSYWQRYWRRRLSRRTLMRGTALGAAGLAAAAVVGCGDGEEGPAATTPAATTPAATTPAATTPAATATPPAFPPPPKFSTLPSQQLLEDFYWTKMGPQTQKWWEPPTNLGGVFTMVGNPPPSNHPGEIRLGAWGQYYWGFSHSGLVGIDWDHRNNIDLMPFTNKFSVSESWEQPDNQTFIFKLRKGVRWHDISPANGAEMTVDDIKTTYEFLATQQFPGLYFSTISSITEPEPGVLQVKTSEPAAQLMGGFAYCGNYLLNAKHIEEGDDALKEKYIGTGPFMMHKDVPNVLRVAKKVPNWWWPKDEWGNQLPYLDGIAHIVHADGDAVAAAFRADQLEHMKARHTEEFTRMTEEKDAWGQVGVGPCGSCGSFVGLSLRTPIFQDVKVRRALSLAINRQDMLDTLQDGAGTHKFWIAYYWRNKIWPDHYDDQGPWMKYDPEGARNLLKEANIATPLTIDYHMAGVDPRVGLGGTVVSPVELYMRDFKAVGIELDFKVVESGGALNRVLYGGEWQGMAGVSMSGAGFDADVIIQSAVTGSGRNPVGISDTRVDDLFRKQREVVDMDERMEIAQELEEYVNQDQLYQGVGVPSRFTFSVWRKHNHNVLESNNAWINAANQLWACLWWQDENAPKRDIDSF